MHVECKNLGDRRLKGDNSKQESVRHGDEESGSAWRCESRRMGELEVA